VRIGVIGINHKLAGIALREALSIACHKRFGTGLSCRHGFVLLSTCNRMELYFSSHNLAETHTYILNILKQEIEEEFSQLLYSFFGQECFCHLSKVAAGLDSAILAETEIQGQVKNAYEAASKVFLLPSPLHYLFQKTLKIAKSIRTKYILGRGLPNLEHALFQSASELFEKPQEKSILFVGASEINQKVLVHLQKKECKNISLCNRSPEKGAFISAKFQIPFLPWNQLHIWPSFDWIIVGTKAHHHLIKAPSSKLFPSKKQLVIDLSFPRNVDPELGNTGIKVINIEEINRCLEFRKAALETDILQAENDIHDSVQRHADLYKMKQENRQFPLKTALKFCT
jgi:glutamyl-tRNA reductase